MKWVRVILALDDGWSCLKSDETEDVHQWLF